MKTKHLFLATALMASFAACTNEEIVSDVQQNVATGRPTVENVKLTFGEGVDSRLIYNKGWKWEATDQIGALLMDTPAEDWHVANTPWAEKYTLSHHIHTSYPFSYNSEDKTWGTPGKMLEGNYFFAYPYESYEGQRMVAHSLINQKQEGITAGVRAKSYADNQFFIGYDRIVAGTQDVEALNNVSMTSVLGAIELRLVNTGTQTYNINKVVLSGAELASKLTFNPTEDAQPEAYSYINDEEFNSANYLDLDDEKEWKLDLSAYKDYDKAEALRAVVKPVADEENDNFAQIIIEGEDRALLPDAENTAYVLIMANPIPEVAVDELFLSIYTDEGYVSNIDLGKVNKSSLNKYGYITDAAIEEIHPEVKNVITVQLDDNAFETPDEMEIFNTQDLEQFILWNSKISGKRNIIAKLKKDVELTEAAYEALTGKANLKLTIEGAKVLTLAEELPANALDAANLVLDATSTPSVKVLGEIALTDDSVEPTSIEVAKGAELIINDTKIKVVDVVNYGTLTIGKNGNLSSSSEIENNGLMTVAAGANIKAEVTNYNEIELAGDLDNVVENAEEAEITMEEGATMGVTTNNGTINTEDEVELTVATNAGLIVFVEGAEVEVTTENGMTARKVSGAVTNESTDPKSYVNTWIVTKDASFAADAAIKHMIVEDGADLEVAKDKVLAVDNLTIKGTTTTEGAISVKTMIVEEDGDLTIEGSITGNGNLLNYGFIDTNDNLSYNIENGKTPVIGDYKGAFTPTYGAAPDSNDLIKARTEYRKALVNAVEEWAAMSGEWTTIDVLNYNLKDFETEVTLQDDTEIEGADELFADYYKRISTNATLLANSSYADVAALKTKFEAYKNLDGDAEVTEYYPTAADSVLIRYQGTVWNSTYKEFEYQKSADLFSALKDALTWDVTDADDAASRIYKAKYYEYTDSNNEPKREMKDAAWWATEAYTAAVLSGKINKNGTTTLTTMEKAMLMTEGNNNAPAYSQVFETTDIYKIFGTEGIGAVADWEEEVGGSFIQQFSMNNPNLWELQDVIDWVNQAENYDGINAYGKAAKAYVEASNNAVLNASKLWEYDDRVIAAIVSDYNNWSAVTSNTTINQPQP